MARNLDEKIRIVLEDAESLSKAELIGRIKELILNEVKFHAGEHILTNKDLTYIHSTAIRTFNTEDLNTLLYENQVAMDMQLARTWCFLDATIGYLRSKELIDFTLKYKHKLPTRR